MAKVKGSSNGRLYESPQELEKKINEYFEKCKGEPLLDDEGNPVYFKNTVIYREEPMAPSEAGIAVYCGFASRQGLLNYRGYGKEYADVLDRAKLKLEEFCYKKLFTKEGFNGARFSLIYNHGVDATEDDKDLKVTVNVVGTEPQNIT